MARHSVQVHLGDDTLRMLQPAKNGLNARGINALCIPLLI